MTNFVFGALIGLAIFVAFALVAFIWFWTEFEAMSVGLVLAPGS
jgi:tetrahydromethanopterin S-methyltransferase subunit B